MKQGFPDSCKDNRMQKVDAACKNNAKIETWTFTNWSS